MSQDRQLSRRWASTERGASVSSECQARAAVRTSVADRAESRRATAEALALNDGRLARLYSTSNVAATIATPLTIRDHAPVWRRATGGGGIG